MADKMENGQGHWQGTDLPECLQLFRNWRSYETKCQFKVSSTSIKRGLIISQR